MSALKSFFDDGRATLRRWRVYKRQTGEVPWLWIAVHVLNWIAVIAVLAYSLRLTSKYHLSRGETWGALVVLAIPYGILWLWMKDKVKLIHLKKQRSLAKIKVRR